MMTLARETGCTFSIGTDAHNPKSIENAGGYGRFDRFTDVCGITKILFND